MFGRTGIRKIADQLDIFWLGEPLYGVLQHVKVHLMQLNILWPGGSVRRIAKSELCDVTYFLTSR